MYVQVRNLFLRIQTHGIIVEARNHGACGVERRHLAIKPCTRTKIGIHTTTDVCRDILGENVRCYSNLIQFPRTIKQRS